MAKVFLSLGSNQGDRLNILAEATKLIDNLIGRMVLCSAVVESEPWGFIADTSFYNMVIVIETQYSPNHVLTKLLDIEKTLGRIRTDSNAYSSRVIDLDMLFYDNQVIDNENLTVPHPRLHLRKFVLKPLASVAPEWVHPVMGVSMSELLVSLNDDSQVEFVVSESQFVKLL